MSIDFTTVSITYPSSPKRYTHICPTDLAETLTPESTVLVENAYGYAVGHVVEVHKTPKLIPDIRYKWIITCIDGIIATKVPPLHAHATAISSDKKNNITYHQKEA